MPVACVVLALGWPYAPVADAGCLRDVGLVVAWSTGCGCRLLCIFAVSFNFVSWHFTAVVMVANVKVRFCLAVAVFCPGCGPGCLYSHMLAFAPSSSK